MKITKAAQAGSLESCDILITVEPLKGKTGIDLKLESPAEVSFGDKIREEIMEVVEKYDITDIQITAVDKGALGYCIKARIETALKRAIGEE
ncbi:MAG: citrate lyase acyl carrier protein [Candidatus Heimdallarchaeota archaeon]|nr:citrate lyase acyl carrier protein [Candidatus Heimdallarchaeota archaeon]